MDIGKVPNKLLQKLILDKINFKRDEVIIRPKIGEDCAAIDFGDYACVLSSDPITGAVNEVGRLAVHISCNDIASCGVEPLGLIVTILAPAGTTTKELNIVMEQVCSTANSLNVDIIGGHTEVTSSVNRFVLTTTAIGKALKDKLITSSGAEPGDFVVMTKAAGLEGTAIIAHDKEELLVGPLGKELVERAKSLMNSISVVKEGVLAGKYGATAMHDVTEGGILGALWEVSEASETGICVYKESIPILDETRAIADYFSINPLMLISSGCMIITCKDGEAMAGMLRENGIEATVIGRITRELTKTIVSEYAREEITQPESDELYKVI